MLMQRMRSQVLIVDVQDALAPHIETVKEVVANTRRLAAYAARLEVPATFTEHYPKGLGATVDSVREAAADDTPVLPKITFSCWQDAGIKTRLESLRKKKRDQIVVAGMEAHVCVMQTVLDLLTAKFEVFLVADAVGSRKARVRDLAIDRMRAAGATIVAHEMVAFEWLERGDTPDFREIVKLVK
jgi:nicotinamidase-related amidase